MPLKYTNKLSNARILVLGGTSGIGFCVAENSLENGATVIVASSQQSSIDKTLTRLRESYPDLTSKISGFTVDLASPNSESNIVNLLKSATDDGANPLDHIVNTATNRIAIQPLAEYNGEQMTIDAFRVRLMAAMFIAKHAPGTYLKKSTKSSITFTGGVNTYRPTPGWSLPAAAGGSLDGLGRALAVDLAPIRVNVIAPGAIDTELLQRTFASNYEALLKRFADMSLLGKVGTPEDMSEAYLYVMRDSFVTGQVLLSEGGLLLKA